MGLMPVSYWACSGHGSEIVNSPARKSRHRKSVWHVSRALMAVSLQVMIWYWIIWGFTVSEVLAQSFSDGIAAIVNSEVITLSELQHELKDETIRLKAKFSGKALRQKLIQKEYEVLNRLIERKLQVQEAKSKGLAITKEDFQRAMDQVRSNRGPTASLENISEKVLREELLISKLIGFEVRRNLMVSPGELLAYYENSKNQFLEPAEYHLRQILLLPKLDDTDQTLKHKATGLLEKIRDGQPFAEVAQVHSDGPESVQGGDLGYVRKDELLDALGKTLGRLKPGGVSAPLRSTIGLHILMLEDIKLGKVQNFEEVKDEIQAELFQKKTQEAQQEWLSSLKDKAYIEIKL